MWIFTVLFFCNLVSAVICGRRAWIDWQYGNDYSAVFYLTFWFIAVIAMVLCLLQIVE